MQASVILTQARWGGDFPDPNDAVGCQRILREFECPPSYSVKKGFVVEAKSLGAHSECNVKKKWHTYCVSATPNRWEPIVVAIDFRKVHTL